MIADLFRPYKVSAVYHLHCALNARWIESAGWRVAAGFDNPETEASRVKAGAGLQDVSSLGKVDVKGTSVEACLAAFTDLQDVIAVLPLKPGHVLILTTTGREEQTIAAIALLSDRVAGCMHITATTSGQSAFALIGPSSGSVLSGLTSLDVRPDRFQDGACAQASVAHVHGTICRRDWGSLPGYLLLVGRDVGEFVWTTIQEEGHAYGLIPFGVDTERLLAPPDASTRPRMSSPDVAFTVASQAS
jgi:sarcosine oxidase subunit alpha